MLWLASVFLRPIARKEIVADEERAVNGSAPLPLLTLLAVCNSSELLRNRAGVSAFCVSSESDASPWQQIDSISE
jgi:hypothetical protein